MLGLRAFGTDHSAEPLVGFVMGWLTTAVLVLLCSSSCPLCLYLDDYPFDLHPSTKLCDPLRNRRLLFASFRLSFLSPFLSPLQNSVFGFKRFSSVYNSITASPPIRFARSKLTSDSVLPGANASVERISPPCPIHDEQNNSSDLLCRA